MNLKTFISYCAQDKELAQRLKVELSRSGCKPWQFDLSAIPGTDAWGTILERIETSDFFVVLLSKAATESRPVKEEISHAHYSSINNPGSRPRIIPLIIEEDVLVPRQIVRAVRLQFGELQFESDFERLLIALGVEDSPFGSATELDVTFSQGREFDTKREAGLYASNLIANNPHVSAIFHKLSANARLAAGGRWRMPSPQEIFWEEETYREHRQPQYVRVCNYKVTVFFCAALRIQQRLFE